MAASESENNAQEIAECKVHLEDIREFLLVLGEFLVCMNQDSRHVEIVKRGLWNLDPEKARSLNESIRGY